jgi:hypothetical protein
MEDKPILIEARMQDEEFLYLCIQRLYQQQEADEQSHSYTKHQNGVGFNKSDSPFLSWCAVKINETGKLSPGETIETRRIMKKYTKQLCSLIKDEEI